MHPWESQGAKDGESSGGSYILDVLGKKRKHTPTISCLVALFQHMISTGLGEALFDCWHETVPDIWRLSVTVPSNAFVYANLPIFPRVTNWL